MSDIVERLRSQADDTYGYPPCSLMLEAADQIERLRAALQAFIAAAKDVQDYWSDPSSYTHNRLLTPMLVHEDVIGVHDDKVECPNCHGQGEVRGPQSDMPWFECRCCGGKGMVTEQQALDWPAAP